MCVKLSTHLRRLAQVLGWSSLDSSLGVLCVGAGEDQSSFGLDSFTVVQDSSLFNSSCFEEAIEAQEPAESLFSPEDFCARRLDGAVVVAAALKAEGDEDNEAYTTRLIKTYLFRV